MSPWIGPGRTIATLDHQVVEIPRLQARQHGHLGPAFDLEHAQRVGLADHVVDSGIVGRHGGEVVAPAVMLRQQVEALADAGEHAERQHVDLEDAQRIEIVLVPFDDRAVFHGRILDRRQFVQWPVGDDEAAGMLGQVAREADQLQRQQEGAAQGGVGRVEPGLADSVGLQAVVAPAPDRPGQDIDRVFRQAERLCRPRGSRCAAGR